MKIIRSLITLIILVGSIAIVHAQEQSLPAIYMIQGMAYLPGYEGATGATFFIDFSAQTATLFAEKNGEKIEYTASLDQNTLQATYHEGTIIDIDEGYYVDTYTFSISTIKENNIALSIHISEPREKAGIDLPGGGGRTQAADQKRVNTDTEDYQEVHVSISSGPQSIYFTGTQLVPIVSNPIRIWRKNAVIDKAPKAAQKPSLGTILLYRLFTGEMSPQTLPESIPGGCGEPGCDYHDEASGMHTTYDISKL